MERDYNPAVVPALCRLAEVAREEDGFMAGEAVKAFDKAVVTAEGGLGLKIDSLAALPLAVARRLVRLAYKRVTGDVYELDFLHTGKVLQLLNQRTGQEAVLPYNVQAVRSREMLYLLHRREKETPDFIRPVTLPGTTALPELSVVLEARLVDSGFNPKELPSNEALLDFDLLSPPLFARRRRPGDVFQPFGFPAPVKLKDFLIGQKVPRHCRDRLLVVEDALGILWIAGLRVGSRAAVTPKTKRCLHLRTVARPHEDLSENIDV
ncbi:MAG: tRNA lysidine(34) synthetase TilS [Firmicutes bacterium]|nr:tRNA lysidine(34) synthetase TilS [Bacillota bacterium]